MDDESVDSVLLLYLHDVRFCYVFEADDRVDQASGFIALAPMLDPRANFQRQQQLGPE